MKLYFGVTGKRVIRSLIGLSIIAAGFILAGCTAADNPVSSPTPTASQSPAPTPSSSPEVLFVALGDFGSGDSNQKRVAESIAEIDPDWFISLGDNVYSQAGYEELVGKYYGEFIDSLRFLPATGNHDYKEGIASFDNYFGTSKSTRYYSKSISKDIDVFVLDSQAALNSEKSMKLQKAWLRESVKQSNAKFKIVVLHHPPFSSGAEHGSNPEFQWNFAKLGITAVISGHEHLYERLQIAGVQYLVSGAGGRDLYECGRPIAGLEKCIDGRFGALFFTPDGEFLLVEFRAANGRVLDSFKLD